MKEGAPENLWTASLPGFTFYTRNGAEKGLRVSADGRTFTVVAQNAKDSAYELTAWRNTTPQPQMLGSFPLKVSPGNYVGALSPDGRFLAHTPNAQTEVV